MACYFPFMGDNPNYDKTNPNSSPKAPFACGKCPYCLQRRANNWVFRCMKHLESSQTGYFVTLTYQQPPFTEKGLMTVRKRCFQLFIKRLRRKLPAKDVNGKSLIKYYACAEYGDTYHRPHFHAIIFNATPEAIQQAWESYHESVALKSRRFTIVNGYIKIDVVNENTVMYTAKYMNKGKIVGKAGWDDRTPEFQLFSQDLGISYLTPETISWHQQDPSFMFSWQNGYKIALPRYFRDKIFNDEAKTAQSDLAQEKSLQTLQLHYEEYQAAKSPGQTFEEFRFARKNSALANFRQKTSERNKFR
jgi:hypothetical protein